MRTLHPLQMLRVDKKQFLNQMKLVEKFDEIDDFFEEANLWYELWANRSQEDQGFKQQKEMDLFSLATHAQLLPAVHSAIFIALTLPSTTCTIERSFSTLRRVKTWLRSSMSDERLSGLCMMSVHRSKISSNKKEYIEKVIDMFGSESRRMKFLFSE